MAWAWLAFAALCVAWLTLLLWAVIGRRLPWESLGPIHAWYRAERAAIGIALAPVGCAVAWWLGYVSGAFALIASTACGAVFAAYTMQSLVIAGESGAILNGRYVPWNEVRRVVLRRDGFVDFVTRDAHLPLGLSSRMRRPPAEFCERLRAVLLRVHVELHDERIEGASQSPR